MSYLAAIVARATGAEPALQPRATSRYESFAPLEESAIEIVAPPAPPRTERTPPMHREPALLPVPPLTHSYERAGLAPDPQPANTPREQHEASARPIETSTVRERERTLERESRVETHHHDDHHHHTARETLLHETNTIVESSTHESSEPPLRALLQPQSLRTIEHLTREHATTMLREAQAPEAPPSIRVTIGRVDVRTITAPPSAAKPAAPRPKPFTLDDYVRLRDGGRR